MKITINSTDLSRALAAVSRCIASKSVLPILECSHIEAVGEELRITASDNENWFSIMVRPTDITYLDDGFDHAFCVESKRFLAAIRELPSQPIGLELSADHTFATLRWLNGEAQLPILLAAEYPMPVAQPQQGESSKRQLSTAALRQIIDTCGFATANDELRPVMNGIFFDRGDNGLVCCATNGHLMVRFACNDIAPLADTFILPSRTANMLGTLIAEQERRSPRGEQPMATVDVSGCNVCFRTECASLVCRMIEGRYPNYNSVIPKNSPYEMILSRADFVSSLRRIMVFANPASLLVKVQVSAGRLTLSASDIDFSTSSEETVPCTFNGPDNFTIGFKGSLLLELLNHISSPEVKVQLTGHNCAGIFQPHGSGSEDRQLLMLLMPMMLDK